jgi:hypothetical protein
MALRSFLFAESLLRRSPTCLSYLLQTDLSAPLKKMQAHGLPLLRVIRTRRKVNFEYGLLKGLLHLQDPG